MNEVLNAVQWPAMIATLIAAWLVGSQTKRKRSLGFFCFIVSNVLWVVWGWHEHAYALVVLQLGLFTLNLRGARKNEPQGGRKPSVQQSGSADANAPGGASDPRNGI